MKKSQLLLLAMLMGTFSTLSSSPLDTPLQVQTQTQKVENLKDGKNIVIGSFDNRQDADVQLSTLLDVMDSSSKIVNLELLHGFDYAVKDQNGTYLVSIEPFVEDKVLYEVLAIVKEHYPKAYAAECKGCVREEFMQWSLQQREAKERELLENAVAQEHMGEPVKVRVENESVEEKPAPVVKPAAAKEEAFSLPFKTEYLLYGVGGLALLILVYLLMRKPKKPSGEALKELYVQAEALEKEMGAEAEPAAATEEPAVVSEEPEVQLESDLTVTEEAPETLPVEKEVVPAVKEGKALNHKLREPNSAVTEISKENFKEFAGLHLLIAEDNLINQKVIVGLLKESGINIKIANDGQECLDILQEDSNYQIILMDAHMPRVDGLEATRQIRANPAYDHITVMALSGDTGVDDIRKMRDAGMEEQLEKPLKIAALYQALYCYFDPNATTAAEEEAAIHLDNSLGLEMLGGDVELYHEVLAEFQSLYHDSDEKIEIWLKHGDFDKAKALLLDVKGIAESVGAAALTQTAEEFREAIIAGQSDQYPKLMKRYQTQLQSILSDMAEV
ncbi:response regulator [Sulfurimonas sp. HSL3-7]|uniref:response regulator n=1 Tax=Sulfonitrofixus jiaomeiensis TaxID=3131938 RepID=UPI0031F723E4